MERRAVEVCGIVQGVGFRPFVFALAERHQLGGFVLNHTGGVRIEVEGKVPALDHFLSDLAAHPPPLARIESVSWEPRPPQGDTLFRIAASDADAAGPVFLSPDAATCAECLAELFDPADRRFGYPFLNCTNCGPRLTIITGAPYDRPRTTMGRFPMCAACRAEYDDPRDRRFHAQPIACPACGPQLQLLDAVGKVVATDSPLALFAAAVRAGQIGAMKGLGGYHLVCLAGQATAVAELRRRKHREEKPFAVMVADVAAAAGLGEVGTAERALLESPQCPIVLLRKRPSPHTAEPVAPGNPFLGVMLPYTPLHHLLLRAVGGMPLVMTSGNRSDEPIAYRDVEAVEKLAGIADLFLVHNRPIHVRCDDSVTRVAAGVEQPLRRSRGYAPRPIALPFECPEPILAVGGQMKATFALGRGRQAFLSHHLGDLDHYEAYQAFEKDVSLYQELFAVAPWVVACDLHPDYASTQYARGCAEQLGTRVRMVQHHHAHMASCMVENGLTGTVIGVTFDGTGYGTDGAVWGGEFLVGDCRGFRRAAHLRYVGMPGGDRAVREPWRMALAHLRDAEVTISRFQAHLLHTERSAVERMIERRFQAPLTSSVGRLFDAVAALAGLRDRVGYEAQAAMELEWLACESDADGIYPFALDAVRDAPKDGLTSSEMLQIDSRPLIRSVADEATRGINAATIARRFHSTLVELIAAVCDRVRVGTGLDAVVLSGGVFLNALLTREVCERLRGDGFRVYRHRLVPPGDGGLSLGQLAVAAQNI